MISAFTQRELQLSFFANETTSTVYLVHAKVYGKPCKEEEHSIDFYPQCFNNTKTVTSTGESEHDKTNTMSCVASALYYQSGHPQSLTSLRRPSEESLDLWLPIKRTAKTDQTGRMFRLTLFLSVRTDHLVDFCHTPAYVTTASTLFSFHWKAAGYIYTKRFAMLELEMTPPIFTGKRSFKWPIERQK